MMRRSHPSALGRGEQGAATIYAVLLIAVLVLSSLAVVLLAGVFAVRRQMESAADLAALAGAEARQHGRDPCAAADRIAVRNGAQLSICTVVGEDVRVAVVSASEGVLGRFAIPGRARAGPAP